MNVKRIRSVDFAIETLPLAERQKVFAWFDHLANWEKDQLTREASKASTYENVFVLTTADDIRISFNLNKEKNEITVLDITKPSRFEPALSEDEAPRLIEAAKTVQEWVDITKRLPSDDGGYDILKALNDNRKWCGGRPLLPEDSAGQ